MSDTPNLFTQGMDDLTPPEVPEGVHVYRASELGNCTSALAALAMGRQGAPMPESLRPALDAGSEFEAKILRRFKVDVFESLSVGELIALRDQGVIAGVNPEGHVAGQVQVRGMVGSTAMVMGHADDLVHNGDDAYFLVETKAFTKPSWDQFQRGGILAFPRYAMQSTAMMFASGLPQMFVVALLDDAREHIIELDQVVLREPPYSFGKLKAAVMTAEKYASRGELPPCVVGHWPCPMFKEPFCLGKPEAEREVIEDTEFGNQLRLHVAASVVSKREGERRDELKAQFAKYMEANGLSVGIKYQVRDQVGNVLEFEWIERPMPERVMRASTQSYPTVKLVERIDCTKCGHLLNDHTASLQCRECGKDCGRSSDE